MFVGPVIELQAIDVVAVQLVHHCGDVNRLIVLRQETVSRKFRPVRRHINTESGLPYDNAVIHDLNFRQIATVILRGGSPGPRGIARRNGYGLRVHEAG